MQLSQRNQFSGTGDLTLQAGDPAHKMLLIHAGAVGVDYVLLSESGAQWEAGSGTLAVGGGLSRDSVTSNHLGTTAKVDFDAGLHLVLIDEGAGGGGSLAVKEGGSTVSSAVTTFDFGAGFDVTESPAGEANVALDMAEAPYDNATSGLAATNVQAAIDELAASGGGTVKIDVGTCSSDGGLALSTDGRTVTVSSSTVGSICTDLTFGGDGGKYYCEYEIIDDGSGGGPQCGIGVETPYGKRVSRGFTGEGISSWAYWNNGDRYTAASPVAYGSTYTTGDIVGWAVDQTAGSIWFHKNGTFVGDPVAGTGSAYTDNKLKLPLHGALCPYTNTASIRLRIASENSYSPPTGFSAAYS